MSTPEKDRRYSWPAILGAIAILAVIALAALYFNGNLDRPLYGIGLNHNECARNGLGATFCGSELEEVRERINKVKLSGEEATRKLEASEAKSKEEREQRQSTEHEEEERKLEAKLSREKRLSETEPAGSFGGVLAHDEYETARSELNQLRAE